MNDIHGCPCCGSGFGELLGFSRDRLLSDGLIQPQQRSRTVFSRRTLLQTTAAVSVVALAACADPTTNIPAANTATDVRVYFGGPILTMDEHFSVPEAIAIRGETISAVGRRIDVEEEAGPGAELIDLQGHAMLPGFIDPHTHIVIGALLDQTMDYVGMTRFETKSDVLEHLASKADAVSTGEWIVARNYTPMLQGAGAPLTRDELDAASPQNPVAVMNASGHILYVNSLALAAAGIEEDVTDPSGGKYGRTEDGRLNGEIYNGLVYMRVLNAWGGISSSNPIQAIVQTCHEFARLGLTTVTEMSLGGLSQGVGDLNLLQQAAATGDLAQRLRVYCLYSFGEQFAEAGVKMDDGDALLRVSGVKLMADGSNQGFTGLQREPYLGRSDNGLAYMKPDEMKEIMAKRASENWQIAIHGNGDKGIDNILDAAEAVQEQGIDIGNNRLRIEHCSILHDEQIERMKSLGISASFLIPHVHYWGVAMRDSIFGEEKAKLLDRCASCEAAGVGFTLHSDFFVTDPDPLHLVQIAVTRDTWAEPDFTLAPNERISVESALRAVTSEAAWQLGSEHEIGSLEVGKLADFVILDADPRKVTPTSIRTINVIETWMNGIRRFPT